MTLLQRNGPERPVGDRRMDAEAVVARLEEAGRTLLALPQSGPSTRLVQSGMEWVRDAQESQVRDRTRLRPAAPDAASITRMDEALGWIPLIPVDKYVLRRIVGARCLVNPMNGKYVFSWRRLGGAIGADHKAVKQWHAKGIAMIVAILGERITAGAGGQPPAGALSLQRRPMPDVPARQSSGIGPAGRRLARGLETGR